MRDVLEGNIRNNARITYPVQLWLWSQSNQLPADFLDYPASIVNEVMYMMQAAEDIKNDIAERKTREAEIKRKMESNTRG